MSKPKVTIAVPIYKVERYIERCVISLFEQTYTNIEYIFINDCTPDKSIKILNKIINEYASRKDSIKIIDHKTNRGLAAARNTAVEYATGDFILWVDSDDYIDVKTVELLISKQKENDYDIISFGFKVYYKKYIEIWKQPKYSCPKEMTNCILERKAPVCVAGRLIRLSLYKGLNIKAKEGVNIGEDYQVSPILSYYAQRVCTLNEVLYHYDCTNINAYTYLFSEDKANQVWSTIKILEDFFQDKDKEYINAIDKAKTRTIARQIIDSSKEKGHESYYHFLRNKLKSFDKSLWSTLDIPTRTALYIPNIKLLKIYVIITGKIKHIFQAIKTGTIYLNK